MLLSLTIFMLMMFMLNSHPLFLSLLLMIFSFIYGFIVALNSDSSWLAYMLIMVFLSGMMIIIMYMTSLSSNDTIVLNPYLTGASLSFSILMFFYSYFLTLNTTLSAKISAYFSPNSMSMIFKTYSSTLAEMTAALILYLLIVLIVAVKILLLNKGPLKMTKPL